MVKLLVWQNQKSFLAGTPLQISKMKSPLFWECLGTRRYLGLSSMIGKKKKVVFNYLKDKIWKKINC